MRSALLSIGLALSLSSWASASSLRDQLELARKDTDQMAQIEIIQRILVTEPGDQALREELADLWLAVEDHDLAEKIVADEAAVSPSVRTRVKAQVLYQRDGKKAEAVALLTAYHQKSPDDLDVTRLLADYLGATGQNQALIALLDQAPGVSADPALLVARAEARRAVADFPGALQDFKTAESAGGDLSVVTSRRPAFERLREAQDHLLGATTALEKNPADLSALIARAYWYLYSGFGSESAAVSAEAVRQKEPAFVSGTLLYAYAAVPAGKLTAEKALKELEVDVSKPLPDWKAVEQILKNDLSLKAKPREVKLLAAREAVLLAAQQYLLAENDTDAVLALAPKDTSARADRIFILTKLRDYDRALEEYRVLEAARPSSERLARGAGYLVDAMFEQGRFEVALDYANRTIKAAPSAAAYKQRAAVLQRLNRGAEADADIAKANSLPGKANR